MKSLVKTLFSLGYLAGMLALASVCQAYPSLLGPTGGVNLPVADVTSPNKIDFAADVSGSFDVQQGDSGNYAHYSFPGSLRILYQIVPRGEIGVTYNHATYSTSAPLPAASQDVDGVGMNAKYVLPFRIEKVALAVGGVHQDLGGASFTQYYGVGSHIDRLSTNVALRTSCGMNWTDMTHPEASADSTVRPFIDMDLAVRVNPYVGLNVIGEYQSNGLSGEQPL